MLKVTVCALEVVLTAWLPNASELLSICPEVRRPVPDSETAWVPTPVGIESEPEFAPILAGEYVSEYVQFELAASDAPQVVDPILKGAVTVAADTVALVLPVFVNVTVCAADVEPTVWLPNATDEGEAPSTARRPVPLRLAVYVPPAVLAVSVPACAPIVPGVKVTVMVQLAPDATLVPHVFVAANGPLAETLVTPRAVLPVLLSVTVCAAEVVPTP